MKKLTAFASAVVCALAFSAANAASSSAMKVGVVDLPMILQKAPQVSAINDKLKNEFSSQQKTIMELQAKIRGEIGKLSGDTSKMSADDKKKLQDQIGGDQKELQQQVMKLQQSLAEAQSNEMQKFMSEIDSASEKVAGKKGLDMVMLKQAVLYPQGTDITKDVMDLLPSK